MRSMLYEWRALVWQARETRDMREGRDVDKLDFRLVSPVPPVSLGYPIKTQPTSRFPGPSTRRYNPHSTSRHR